MQIESGLHTHGVLQRNAQNVSDAVVTGSCTRDGKVLLTVSQGTRPLAKFMGETVGVAEKGRFSCELKGIPVGGPYRVQLCIASATGKWVDTTEVDDVLVGDLWLLGGQSNMQGVGLLKDAPATHPEVRAFYLDDRWEVARETLHDISTSVDDVHRVLCGGSLPPPNTLTGVGPGHAFGLEMQRRRKVPQGLIAAAHGGTSMTQWDPKRRDENGNSLYGAMIRRLRACGGKVCGMIWYQGESDANGDAAPLFTKRMIEFVDALRRDAGTPAMPVAMVQISRVIGWSRESGRYWNAIQEQQRRLAEKVERLACVPAIDLSMDDNIHISGKGQSILGRRLAEAMQCLTGDQTLSPPIELAEVKSQVTERNLADIHVRFRHVVGELRSGARPWGFQLVTRDGEPLERIFDVELRGDTAIVHTGLAPFEADMHLLHYGYQSNPYCNIVDEAGRSLPVLGPASIGIPKALSPAIRRVLVSPIFTGAGKLEGLAYPTELESLQLTPRDFPTDFCDRHLEISGRGGEDCLLYYAVHLVVDEPMPIVFLIGYDGPVKVWLDGEERHHDPEGCNPAVADRVKLSAELAPGRHTLLVALGGNNGRAWGVFLRMLRPDVPPEAVLEQAYSFPRLEP